MAKVYEFLANGFEEVEGLAPVDILRRGGVDIKTVSVTGTPWVETSHGITLKADLTIEEADLSDADMLLLPGGLPGATNLHDHEGVRKAWWLRLLRADALALSVQLRWCWGRWVCSKARRPLATLASKSL